VGVVSATSFTGNLTGNVTGQILGVQTSITVGDTFIQSNAIGLGATDTTGRNAGVGTATGTLIYNATTIGLEVYTGTDWINVGDLASGIKASGGSITQAGGKTIHTFTGSGNFKINNSYLTSVELLIVGGGGGAAGGGGGAGSVIYQTSAPVSAFPGLYSVTIGAGGPNVFPGSGTGNPSTIFGYTAAGGGGGSRPGRGTPDGTGEPGGSGGGGWENLTGGTASGASGGTANTASPPAGWGNAGGNGATSGAAGGCSGGGGGAAAAGTNGTFPAPSPAPHGRAGNGGNGLQFSISGTSTFYAGGGGGGTFYQPSPTAPVPNAPLVLGTGGSGGGGSFRPGVGPEQAGQANTGGGAGATYASGSTGGSGIVIIAYPS
jgi:hypothetical protein